MLPVINTAITSPPSLTYIIIAQLSVTFVCKSPHEASKTKDTPERKEISAIDEYDLLTDPELSPNDVLVYVWAKANREGFPPQFVIDVKVRWFKIFGLTKSWWGWWGQLLSLRSRY